MVMGMFPTRSEPIQKEAGAMTLPGRAVEASAVRVSDADVVYAVRPGSRQSLAVHVVSAEVCVRKLVDRHGHTRLELDRGADRIVVSTEASTLTVSSGEAAFAVDLPSAPEDELIRVRTALVASPAIRAFRALASAVDETESDTAERLAVRLSGRLLAQFDGDHGAVRRLSRELHDRYAPQLKRGRRQVPLDWEMYQNSIVHACAELQLAVGGLSYWSPLRHAGALEWVRRVEAAWYAYVASALAWRARQ
jgi:hypothetical protein